MKPHGRDCPDRCSQCIDAIVHRVDLAGGDVTVDGVVVRPIEADATTRKAYGRKGARSTHGR